MDYDAFDKGFECINQKKTIQSWWEATDGPTSSDGRQSSRHGKAELSDTARRPTDLRCTISFHPWWQYSFFLAIVSSVGYAAAATIRKSLRQLPINIYARWRGCIGHHHGSRSLDAAGYVHSFRRFVAVCPSSQIFWVVCPPVRCRRRRETTTMASSSSQHPSISN